MELGFWQFLWKEGANALPLKQRIPEVAQFRGSDLEACYFSSQRGLLQRRPGVEATREALLDRLLALAARRANKADLGTNTPVAILRRPAQAGKAGSHPPQASVLSASELLDLLERKGPGGRIHDFGPGTEWSLQSLALPAEDLRVVVVYSRDPLGEERLDVVGRRYSGIYPLPDGTQWSANSRGSSEEANAHVEVPQEQAAAAEAKTLALVRYVYRFHQRTVESLIAEFIIDSGGRVLLHGFWRVSMFDPPGALSDSLQLQEEDSIAPTVRHSVFEAQSACSTATTAVLGAANQDFGSRPASAQSSNALAGSLTFGSLAEANAVDGTRRWSPPRCGEVAQPFQKEKAVPRAEAGGAAASLTDEADADAFYAAGHRSPLNGSEVTVAPLPAGVGTDGENLGIVEDEGEGDEVEDEIARMEAKARDQAARASSRPSMNGRFQTPSNQHKGFRPQRPSPRGQPVAGDAATVQAQRSVRPLSGRSRPSSASSCGGVGAAPETTALPTGPAPVRPAQARPLSGRSRPSSAGSCGGPGSGSVVLARPLTATTVRGPTRPGTGTPRSRTVSPQEAGARSRSKSAEQLQPSTRSPKRELHSKQLMSRYEYERDLRPRLTSTLSRQLERYREMVPVWNAQKQALRCMLARREQVVEQKHREVEAVKSEREQTDRLYTERLDALSRGLATELEKAKKESEEAHESLKKSQEQETAALTALQYENAKHTQIQTSLDQAVQKLEQMNADMEKCKALVEDPLNQGDDSMEGEATPELMQNLRQIEDTLKAREQIRSQSRTLRAEVILAQDELRRQREYSSRMEEFVRRVAAGGGKYILHPANKKEASRLLAAAAKLRAAAGLKSLDQSEGPAAARS